MVCLPFLWADKYVNWWADGKQNLTLGRTRRGGGDWWIPPPLPIRFSCVYFLKDKTSTPDDFSS